MIDFISSLAMWLADFFLLSTVLLLYALAVLALLKQPARRLAITKSTFVALFILAALCALPGWSLVHLMSRPDPPRPVAAPAVVNHAEFRPAPEPTAPPIEIKADVPTAPSPTPVAVAPTRLPFWATLSWHAIIASSYAVGSLCVFIWLCLGNLAARRLIGSATPAPDSLSHLLTDLSDGQHQNARLLLSEKIDVAVAIGIHRPAIILPQTFAISSSPLATRHSPLKTILAHELAHITNHDLRWLAVSRSLLILLWPQPLFWLLRRRMRLDQEALADAAAAELSSRHTYAEQLVAWARQLPAHPAPRLSAAVGLWESPSQLRQRIALLVDEHFTVLRNCPRGWRLVASGLAVLSAFALSLVTLAAPDPLAEPTGTPQTSIFQHGIERLGVLPKAIFDAQPAVVWKQDPKTLERSSRSPDLGGIAVDGEFGFASNSFGRLFAFDVATGDPKWSYKTNKQARTQAPLVVDTTVYYACGDGVVALARDTGKEIWQHDIPGGAAECSPIVVDGKLFVTGYDGVMRALDAAKGDLIWERELLSDAPAVARGPKGDDARLDGTKARPGIPASDGKAIYQPIFDQMRLVAVDCATGKVLWSFETRGWMHGNPTVRDGRVFVGSQDNHLYAIDATTGKQIWKFPTASRVESGAAIYNDWLYFGCCAGNVYCVDAQTGGEIWRFALDKRNNRSPIYCAPLVTPEGDLYIAGMEGQVYCLDAIGGLLRWQIRPSENSEIDSDLATDGRRLFITTRPDRDDAGESAIFALGPAELAPAKPAGAAVAAVNTDPPRIPAGGVPRPAPNSIVGRAADENNRPIVGAEAVLFRVNQRDYSRRRVAATMTDANGSFRFENVVDIAKEFPAGFSLADELGDELLQVIVRAPGRVTSARLESRQIVAQQGSFESLRMAAAATLRGRVTGPKGEPVVGALVSIGSNAIESGEDITSARTDADGNYAIADAAPFDIAQHREMEARQRRQMEEQIKGAQAYALFLAPPMLTIEHPDFATKKTGYEHIPGTTDVRLDPPAIVEGRVVYADSGKSAANVLVHATTSRTAADRQKGADPYANVAAQTRTDAEGRYRFATLPAGNYDVWAEADAWLNAGASQISAAAEKTTLVPELVFVKGGRIRVRLVDARTHEPIKLRAGARAFMIAMPKTIIGARRIYNNSIEPALDGIFELRALPGKNNVSVYSAVDGDTTWSNDSSVNRSPPEVDVAEGQVVDIDVGLQKQDDKELKANTFVAIAPAPPSAKPANPKSSPTEKIAADKPVDIPIIVAKHVLLHDGKIIEWDDVEKFVMNLPNPKLARPGFYFTTAAIEPRQEEIRAKIWDFRRRQPLAGHTWSGIQARTSLHYDAIRTAADLVPNNDWRVTGSVEGADGLPIVGAQVVLVTAVDESLSYKNVEVYIRNRQLQLPLDEVFGTSDNNGRFTLYRRPGTSHYFIALHDDGFGLVRSDDKSNRIVLEPWANLGGYLDRVAAAKFNGDDTWTIPAAEKWPEFALHVENDAEETPGERAAAVPVAPPDPDEARMSAAEVEPAQPAADDLTVTEKPDRITIGNHFILCRITTDGQRQLLGWTKRPETTASLRLLVNYAAFENGPIDIQSPAFVSLAGQLAKLAKEDDRLLGVRVLTKPPQGVPFNTTSDRAEAIAKVCEQLGRTAGYKHTRASRSFGDYDWPAFVSKAAVAADNAKSTDESVIGNSFIRVYPVRTFLSRTEADSNADCVVEILPVIHQNRAPKFPDDFLAAMRELVPQIEYEARKTIMLRVSYTTAAQKQVEDWVRDESARTAFAKELGFEDCTVSQSQSQSGESEDAPQAGEFTGVVLDPAGSPAAKVRTLAWAGYQRGFLHGQTDDAGRFKFDVAPTEEAILWIQPEDHSPQVHFIDKRRGDLGTYKLENGIQIHGRVVDTDGKPIAGVWVSAWSPRNLGIIPSHMAVSEQMHRSGLTDAAGRFKLAPLPPGAYSVVPQAVPMEGRADRTARPLRAAFLHREFKITAVNELDDIELRAVPSVAVTVNVVDSQGKPAQGFSSFFFSGKIIPEKKAGGGLLSYFFPKSADPPGHHQSSSVFFDSQGKAVVHAPAGMADAQIQIPYSGLSIRHRTEPGGPLSKNLVIELGKLDRNRQVEIIRYKPPTLVVDVNDKSSPGKRPPSVKVMATYTNVEPAQRPTSEQYITREVDFDREPDGRWKSGEIVPDEAFKLSVTADGYEPYEEARSLGEGEQATINVILKKSEPAK